MHKLLGSVALLALGASGLFEPVHSQTIAEWLFDEPLGLYPSHVLEDQSDNDYPLVLGQGGQIVEGRFGNALEPSARPLIDYPKDSVRFGLTQLPVPEGRSVEPMSWMNARFAALMTSGENHLRKEVGFVNPTRCRLNLGDFDWTIEYWFRPTREPGSGGVVLEVGEGPRGENERLTHLLLNPDHRSFTLYNQPAEVRLSIPSAAALQQPDGRWHHLAFVYSASESQLRHYVNGRLQPLPDSSRLKSLREGEEAYLSVGRDGGWNRPLPGRIDEMRISEGCLYRQDFTPPGSFASEPPRVELNAGPPLLFALDEKTAVPIRLGSRKHLFIDDALISDLDGARFTVNPPRRVERVIGQIQGTFRKHLTVVDDGAGIIRLYNSVDNDFLALRTSRDGVHFDVPDLGRETAEGHRNVVIPERVGGMGNPFIDPNGRPEHRWKYLTDYQRRGIYLYTSPDGLNWTRHKTAVLPFRSGSQSAVFYDDQRRRYVSYHRSDVLHTPAGATQRSAIVAEHDNLYQPVAFTPLTQSEYRALDEDLRLREPLPWYLDNGPLTPGGFGMEFPHRFDPMPEDPLGTDLYTTKAQKYPWAPDTYLAFPSVYFHYELDGPVTRQILMDPRRARGSGPLETQLAVSRDGLNWQRYPRPAYVGIGREEGRDVVTAYLAHGMVRRGDEIWQYYFGETQYHSAWKQDPQGRGVYRLVQRLDGFVSIDSPYEREVEVVTRPFTFQGNRLELNVDTDAVGYAQVGFLDENGDPIEGFSVDDCVYINGDFIATRVEWIQNLDDLQNYSVPAEDPDAFVRRVVSTSDLSSLEGQVVQLVFRMRGSKLYAMQFTRETRD